MTASHDHNLSGSQHPEWKVHWERIYAEKSPSEVNWYQSHPEYSLNLIQTASVPADARIIDVGGGASTLVDHLLNAGYRQVTVLDIAHTAIERAQARLGKRAEQVTWREADVTAYVPGQQFSIWHDRAVFHFLTEEEDRSRYLAALNKALEPEGYVIIATFAENGPGQCSGLNVVCYSPGTLGQTLGPGFRLIETLTEDHRTPHGGVQQFIYCMFRRSGHTRP